jgi:hypothetical protein
MVGMVDFGMYSFVLALYWVFFITPFSVLELCRVAVMPDAVACVIDAMVCICFGSFVLGHEVLNGRLSLFVFKFCSWDVRQSFHSLKFCSWDSTSAFASGTKFFR